MQIQKAKKGPRQSVSAEAYGAWNKKADFKARVIPKTEETREKIEKRLKTSFLFLALDAKEFRIVVDAMDEKRFKAGEFVIK